MKDVKKNTGKLFETVIRVVQEALKSSDSTIVSQNHKITDNNGLVREFDVFIESKINNFQIAIAVECKDYKDKIGVDKIEAFHSKCNDVPQINKKIFISRVGFQKGAYVKAKAYGIDLLLLEKINEADVLDWLIISVPRPMNIDRVLARPAVEFIGEPFDFLPSDILISENEGIKMTLFD